MKYLIKLQQFMRGRYGIDELYKFLLYLYFGLFLINIFLKNFILDLIELLIILIMFSRVFSKNIVKRKNENKKYLKILNNFKKKYLNIKKYYQNREYHIYKKCPKCRSILRLPLPLKRGIQHAKCPKCQHRITFMTLRKQKIEIIRKK